MALKALQAASFRGVPFEVEGEDMSAGRRTQVHEYVQRDKPYAEDLGRATRHMSVTGFVTGSDYQDRRDKLLKALEAPGPGTLVHPWYGSVKVNVTECRVSHSAAEGGVVRFTLGFVEAGEQSFPTGSADTGAAVRTSADVTKGRAVDQFSKVFKVAGQPDYVGAAAKVESGSLIARVTSGVKGFTAGIAGNASKVTGGLDALLLDPRGLGQSMQSLFGTVDAIASFPDRAQQAVTSLVSLYKTPAWLSLSRPSLGSVTPSRLQQVDNTNGLRSLMRVTALADAVGAATVMPATVFDDVQAVRDTLFAALDAEAMQANDESFVALTDLRVQMVRDLNTRARDAARLYLHTPAGVMPAVVLAYELYEDPSRASEIAARNKIRNPGFVPALPMKVLSR